MYTYLVLGRMSRLFSLKIQRYSANELIKTYIKKTLGCFSVSFLVCTIFHFVSNQNVTDCTHKDSNLLTDICRSVFNSIAHSNISFYLHFFTCVGASGHKRQNNLRISFAWFVWHFGNYADMLFWLVLFLSISPSPPLLSMVLPSVYLPFAKFIWDIYLNCSCFEYFSPNGFANIAITTNTSASQQTNWNGISRIFLDIFLGSTQQT